MMRSGQEDVVVLVVGEHPDIALARSMCADAHRVVCLTLTVANELAEAAGSRPEVIDWSAGAASMESECWEWSGALTDHLAASGSGLSNEALQATRRMLFQQVLWPIGVARLKARAISRLLPQGAQVLMAGVSELEAAEMSATMGPAVLAPAVTAPAQRDLPAIAPGDAPKKRPSRLGHQFARARYVLFTIPVAEMRRRVHLARLTGRLRPANAGQPRLFVLMGARVHLRLLESTLRELSSRGWQVLVGNWNAELDCADEVEAMGASPVDLEPLAAAATPANRSLIAQRRLHGLRQPIVEWAASAGLETHATFIADGFNERYELVCRWIRAHAALTRSNRPAAILAVNEISDIVESMVPVAARRGIPVVDVQHGSALPIALNRGFRFDALCVWGEADKEMYANLGTPSDIIRVTGNPFITPRTLAAKAHTASNDAHATRAGLRILFAASYVAGVVSDIDLYRTLARVLAYAEQEPDCEVVVKLHPVGEGKEAGYDLASREHPSARVEVTRFGDLYELIAECDCLVTHASTVAIEAVDFRKPIVITSLGEGRDPLTLVADGVALQALDEAEFAACMAQVRAGNAVNEGAYARFAESHSFMPDGHAGQRIASVCEELARTTSR